MIYQHMEEFCPNCGDSSENAKWCKFAACFQCTSCDSFYGGEIDDRPPEEIVKDAWADPDSKSDRCGKT